MYGQTSLVDEGFLAALGVHRLSAPVPFMEAGGPVNLFSIQNDDGTLTLFDAGVNTPDGLAAIQAMAGEAGVDFGKVSRILVSHGHLDHFGNAQRFSEATGAPIYVHAADRTKLLGEERYAALLERHHGYFLKLGVPAETLRGLAVGAKRALEGRAVEASRLLPLEDGQVFRFRHFDARIVHCPGHTPGLVCLHAEAQRLFFANDHLLERVSPNPLLDLSQGEGETKFLALVQYVESVKKVAALPLDCVLPGHGEAFRGHVSLIEGLLEFYGKRQAKLLGFLAAGPTTVLGLTELLYVRRDASRLVLMLSEVLANLEVMELAGQVRRELAGGRWLFSPA